MCDPLCCKKLNLAVKDEPVREWTCTDWRHMWNGYSAPLAVAIVICGLVGGSVACAACVIRDYPDEVWRVVVSAVFIGVYGIAFLSIMVSYYRIIFSRPGFVERTPWRHRPYFVLEEQTASDNQAGGGGAVRPVATTTTTTTTRVSPSYSAAADHLPSQNAREKREEEEVGAGHVSNPLVGSNGDDIPKRKESVAVLAHVSSSDTPKEDAEATPQPRDADAAVPASANSARSIAGPMPPTPRATPTTTTAPTTTTGTPVEATLVAARSSSNSPDTKAQGNKLPRQPPTLHQEENHCMGEDAYNGKNPYVVTQVDRWGNLRFCLDCGIYKPDGAYHCVICQRCVYHFDHHCLWVNNCIGRNNYKLFMCFLMFAGLGCDIACILNFVEIFAVDPRPIKERLPWLVVPILVLVLGIILTHFWIEHRCWTCKGMTTMDDVVGRRIMHEKKQQPPEQRTLTAAERSYVGPKTKEQIDDHIRGYWGNETGIRALLACSVRTDDTPEGCRVMLPTASAPV